jgi:hypothetical protein
MAEESTSLSSLQVIMDFSVVVGTLDAGQIRTLMRGVVCSPRISDLPSAYKINSNPLLATRT